jgi:hypothetical protein
MVYAMMSIGVLGFVVWSWWLASLIYNYEVLNFAICWDSLESKSTFNSENLLDYTQLAGNLSFIFYIVFLTNNIKYYIKTDKSSSETTRETSFNFNDYRKISGKSSNEISNDWLTW